MPRLVRLSLSVLAVCCLLGAASSVSASAHQTGTTYMKINKAHGTKPSRGSNLLYHGGPIQSPAAVYISWWGSQWNTGFSSGGYSSSEAQSYVTNFFSGVGGTGWGNTTRQYCSSTSCPTNPTGEFAGAWTDTASVPASPTQSDIANAAARLASHFGGVNPSADYMVFTPTGRSENGFGTQWCAYHSSSGSLAYSYMPYQPDAGASCGMNFVNKSNGYFDGFSIVGGHEYAEAITDPQPNTGWLDGRGAEIGDKCAWISSGAGAATNLKVGSQSYAVQSLWSNAAGGCVTTS